MRLLLLSLLMACFAGGQTLPEAAAGVQQRAVPKLARPLSAADFGAKCDGVHDDTAAIQAGLAAAQTTTLARGGQRTLHVEAGQCVVNSQLAIPNYVFMEGEGSRDTELVAGPSFPANTAMIKIGDDSGYAFSTGIRYLMLNLNQAPGSIGIVSGSVQENGGVEHAVITGYGAKGIYFDGSLPGAKGISNFIIRDVEVLAGSRYSGGTGIDIRNSSWKNVVENVSVVPGGGNPGQYAIYAYDAMLVLRGIHMENHTDGLYLDHYAVADGTGIDGESVTNLIHRSRTNMTWVRFGLTHRTLGANIVLDEANNIALTDGYLSMYQTSGANSIILSDTGGNLTAFNPGGTIAMRLDPNQQAPAAEGAPMAGLADAIRWDPTSAGVEAVQAPRPGAGPRQRP